MNINRALFVAIELARTTIMERLLVMDVGDEIEDDNQCKCFFWRSIKHNLVYVCRYQQNCDINPSHRNGCRYCRLQRCLKAGMQPESVRLQAPKIEASDSPKFTPTATKRPATSTTIIGNSPLDSNGGPRSSESDHSQQADDESPMFKQARYDHAELVVKLSELSERIDQLADFNENNHTPKPQTLNLLTIFEHPEFLECYRTRVNFCVRLHSATADELEFAKYRTLVKCFDYLHGLQNIGLTDMPFEDKVKILTGTYAPLTVFEMCFGTTKATKDANLLCLPTSITLSRNQNIPQNGFLSQKLVNNMVSTLTRTIENLELTETEVLLLKAIIMLNQEVHGLTSTTANAVAKLRDRLHGALYQNCMSSDESPTIRFAKLLHILPKLTLLARELVEHIRAVQTFNSSIWTYESLRPGANKIISRARALTGDELFSNANGFSYAIENKIGSSCNLSECLNRQSIIRSHQFDQQQTSGISTKRNSLAFDGNGLASSETN
ncbi:Nuclear hormone receptor family member nhr-97 [Aphelenchoides besseyi]|nr:Nuclear hormone receptor family member nhr-97 [Aphelenchoides besseyi]